MIIRRAKKEDAAQLKEPYFRHLMFSPPKEEQNMGKWAEALELFERSESYYLLVGEEEGNLVSFVTLVIIENLTHNHRPYAVIENVVTHASYKGRHYATALMEEAAETARKHDCYKIMVMTCSKRKSTLDFYKNCGYSATEKTGFLKRL
ncbi:MAG: GNAT family N-acetyltransferase [Hydrogeniiclostridium sp.]